MQEAIKAMSERQAWVIKSSNPEVCLQICLVNVRKQMRPLPEHEVTIFK